MIVVQKDWVSEDYQQVYALPAGSVFQFAENIDYETVMFRLRKYQPETISTFDVRYCSPGTSLYTDFGPNTLCIVKKQNANEV